MLERAGGIADELKQKLLNGIKKYIEQYSVSCEPGYGASLQPYVRTAQAMNAFLKEYPAPAYYKESVRKILWKWFDSAATENGLYIEAYEPVFNKYVDRNLFDPTVELIKMLHSQDGITKEELSAGLNCSEKTVQTLLHRLTSHDDPLKLGGEPIFLQIDFFDAHSDCCNYKYGDKYKKRRHYRTKNTMHPLTFQFNLMQVGTLLYSLSKAYIESEMYSAYYIALNVWCQLSDYARARIKEIFAPQYETLSFLIDDLSDMLDKNIRVFESESEFMHSVGDLSIDEKLLMAYKGSLICTLELLNPLRRLRHQSIHYDFGSHKYYCTSPGSDKIYLNTDDIYDIYED